MLAAWFIRAQLHPRDASAALPPRESAPLAFLERLLYHAEGALMRRVTPPP